jgi:hypothetical protein
MANERTQAQLDNDARLRAAKSKSNFDGLKASHESESREKTMRLKAWAPAELLPEPDKIPGWSYRWIRVATLNQADPRNLSAKLREGWEPVTIEEQPDMQLLSDPNSRYRNNIEIGGLLLCKTPTEFVEQRSAHFAEQTHAQTEAVDNNLMRQSDPRMPMFKERKSSTSFGSR